MGCNSVGNNVRVPKPTASFSFFNSSGLVYELILHDFFQRQILLFLFLSYITGTAESVRSSLIVGFSRDGPFGCNMLLSSKRFIEE
jgi:hypothetical protein